MGIIIVPTSLLLELQKKIWERKQLLQLKLPDGRETSVRRLFHMLSLFTRSFMSLVMSSSR